MGKKVKKNGKLGDSTLEHLAEIKSTGSQLIEAIAQLEGQTYGTAAFGKQLETLEGLADLLKKSAKSTAHSLKKEIKKHPQAAEPEKSKKAAVKKLKTAAKAQ